MDIPTQGTRDPVTQIVLEELRSLRLEINQRLDRLVTTEAFAAEQRRMDGLLSGINEDIANERVARADAIAGSVAAREVAITEVKGAISDVKAAIAKTASHMKWLVAAIIIPVAGIVTTIWLTLRGPV